MFSFIRMNFEKNFVHKNFIFCSFLKNNTKLRFSKAKDFFNFGELIQLVDYHKLIVEQN